MISPECIGLDLGAVLDIINRAKLKGKSSRQKRFAVTLPKPNLPNLPNLPNIPSIPRPRRFSVSLPIRPKTIFRQTGDADAKRRCIPNGSGPFTVGVVDIMSSHSVHGTFMRVFYPTDSTDIHERQLQWPLWLPRKQYIEGYLLFREMNRRILYKLANWFGGDVYIPALWQAPVLKSHERFPVIVFSHGIGANRTTYSTVCLDLASHGFVVAAVEHRDGSASMTYCLNNQARYYDSHPHLGDLDEDLAPHEHDTSPNNLNRAEQWLKYVKYPVLDDFDIRYRQVHHRVKEVSRCLDLLESMNDGEKVDNVLGLRFNINQFQGRLDLSKACVVGHSFGAATTIATLAHDKRFRAGVALDAWMLPIGEEVFDMLDRPLLCINTETFQWRENVLKMMRTKVNMQSDRVLITLKGTCHQSQTDFQFLVNQYVAKFMELRHTASPQQAMDLNNKAVRGFLFKHLGLESTTDDYYEDILRGDHPDVILGTNLDLTSNAPKPTRPTTRVYPDEVVDASPGSPEKDLGPEEKVARTGVRVATPPVRVKSLVLPRMMTYCATAPCDLSPVAEAAAERDEDAAERDEDAAEGAEQGAEGAEAAGGEDPESYMVPIAEWDDITSLTSSSSL